MSIDIASWKGNGALFAADMKEGEAFSHSIVMTKAPDGFAFLADESRYYYITIGNDSEVALTDIKGKLTLDFTGTYQGSKNQVETSAVTDNHTNAIRVDIPQIAPDGYKTYGPYNLKKGDVVSSDLTWSNDDGGVYFAIGKEFMDFKGFFSSYGKY